MAEAKSIVYDVCPNDGVTVKADDFVIRLGSGRTLTHILESKHTQLPDGIELFVGSDVCVPANLRGRDRDLAIHGEDLSKLLDISVNYYDAMNKVWVGPVKPDTMYMDADKTWVIWRGFLDVVIPFESEIVMKMSGSDVVVRPNDPSVPESNQSSVDIIQLVQPPEDYNITLDVYVYNDPAMTDLNTKISAESGSEKYPILVFDGISYRTFPAEGVTIATAGNFVSVDLSNLEYENVVYLKWIWRAVNSDKIAGTGASAYPAFALTNPDNIGFVWETSM